jgi:hypothetical protein
MPIAHVLGYVFALILLLTGFANRINLGQGQPQLPEDCGQ